MPEGRDRLGFQHWRGYNFHADYFNGHVNADGWRLQRWEGYETDALSRYAMDFIDEVSGDAPFCVFVSPRPLNKLIDGHLAGVSGPEGHARIARAGAERRPWFRAMH